MHAVVLFPQLVSTLMPSITYTHLLGSPQLWDCESPPTSLFHLCGLQVHPPVENNKSKYILLVQANYHAVHYSFLGSCQLFEHKQDFCINEYFNINS